METNFETQATASTDLGGIEVAKSRLVITIGLSTITANKNAAAIIMAAGEAKAEIVKNPWRWMRISNILLLPCNL